MMSMKLSSEHGASLKQRETEREPEAPCSAVGSAQVSCEQEDLLWENP